MTKIPWMAPLLTAVVLVGASCQRAPQLTTETTAQTLEEHEVELSVDGMHCETCPLTVKTAAKSVRGVVEVKVTIDPGHARVRYRPSQTSPAVIAHAITESGYQARELPVDSNGP